MIVEFVGGMLSPSQLNFLGQDCEQVGPSEATCSPFDYIMVVAAAPGLRAFASSFESGIQNAPVKRSHGIADLSVLLQVDKVAYAIPHLALGLFDKKGLAGSHESGARFEGDCLDVTSNEGIVGSGSNDGLHIRWS